MTITATFSTGYTDTYKGKRPVKAAWMIVLPSGKIDSGHSLDLATATKTARTRAAEMFRSEVESRRFHYQALKPMARWAHMQGYVREKLRELGFKSVKEHDAALTDARNAFVAQCRIEVVAL